jgi:hypothetical protein
MRVQVTITVMINRRLKVWRLVWVTTGLGLDSFIAVGIGIC